MNTLLTGLGWLAFSLVLFIGVQNWLHREIHACFLLLTRRQNLAIGLFSLLFFPGVALHEVSHFLMARILRVRTGRFSLLPQVLPNGTLRLGYVETAQTDIFRDALIGTAPLLTGGLAIAYLGIAQLQLTPIVNLASQGLWQPAWQGLMAVPNQADFALWFYLAFTISSTMLPSSSDRRAWLPILIGLGILFILALLAGVGEWMLQHLGPGLDQTVRALAMIFTISLGIHFVLAIPFSLLRMVLSKLTGLSVVRV